MDYIVSKIDRYFEKQNNHPVTSRTLSKRIGAQPKMVRYALNNNDRFKKVHKRFVRNTVPLYYYSSL